MGNTKVSTIVLSVLAIFMSSCERPEGEGGKSALEGYVYIVNDAGDGVARNGNGEYYFVRDTVPAVEEDVYIIYGSDAEDFYGDKIDTDYKGRFRFDHLVSGNYVVYTYSAYPNGEKKPVFREAHLGHSCTETVEDIYIEDGKNAGRSAIVGRINARGNYTGPAVEARVFCCELGEVGPISDEKTNFAGEYVFTRLEPGKAYQIWSISSSKKNGVETAVMDTVFVESPSTIYEAAELTVGIY